MSYRDKFHSTAAARGYDDREYERGSVASILWDVERALLPVILRHAQPQNSTIRYLDFACGTGRVLGFLESRMAHSVGIDVSDAMLLEARKKARHSRLICKDIGREDDAVEGVYDVITAFRFFSNADAETRTKVLAGLLRRMHADSVLIANTHTNPISYKLASWPLHQISQLLGKRIHTRYLSLRGLLELMRSANLVPLAVYGYGFVPGRVIDLIGAPRALSIEQRLAHRRVIERFGVNQIVVFKKKRA
jgi:SAM-dependent methyltransferase